MSYNVQLCNLECFLALYELVSFLLTHSLTHLHTILTMMMMMMMMMTEMYLFNVVGVACVGVSSKNRRV